MALSSMNSGIQIRRAQPQEEGCVAELIYGAPSNEAAGIASGVERAAALGKGLFRAGVGRTASDDVFLVFRESDAVGALLARSSGSNFPSSRRRVLRALPVILRLYSPWELPGLVRRAGLRRRLEFPIPPGSYHIVELHVAPEHRGARLGSLLLGHAEAVAQERGCSRINLTTALANPALRLYARHGYVEVARRTVPGYAQLTGSPGRAFLEKLLPARRAV